MEDKDFHCLSKFCSFKWEKSAFSFWGSLSFDTTSMSSLLILLRRKQIKRLDYDRNKLDEISKPFNRNNSFRHFKRSIYFGLIKKHQIMVNSLK